MSRARREPAPIPEEPKSAKRLRTAPGLSIAEFAARKPAKRLYGEERARAEMEERAASGDWDGASGAHLVCLYEFLHRSVYGVDSDIDRKSRMFAGSAAERMIKRDFAEDAGRAVLFMKWVWKREQEREAWRRANNRDGGRVGWRLQFCFASLVTDYRVHVARQGEQ
jgi:hypothetical protein